MGHWLGSHLHIVLAYGYEVLGGLLIFYSSAVTETSMPEDRKRIGHWVMFAAMALVYAAFGIGLRYDQIQQSERERQQSTQDRKELRDNRDRMDNRMDNILSSSQSTYLQLALLGSELRNMRVSLTQAIDKNDPDKLSSLQTQAKTAQQQVDSISHELLAITMAPQIAVQLRSWEDQRKQARQDDHLRSWEEQNHFALEHRGEPGFQEALNRIGKFWDERYEHTEDVYLEKLKGAISTADFIRREMLQRIPLQAQSAEDKRYEKEFDQAKGNPESLNRDNAAQYLEDLARRVPPPK